MVVMVLPEASLAFFSPVFMKKHHRVRVQHSRWE
jgi:hypothetical protein